jgi:hypothetical protein
MNFISKILSVFGLKRISVGNNPAYDKAYDEWKEDSKNLLLATKKMLEKSGLDTKDIDDLLKKYHNY